MKKEIKDEINIIFHTHYFNILLCGRTGSGKSTFINRFLGEKKAFTLKAKSTGTYRNNYYIHRKYPIKIIDVCGFAEGSEAKENLEKINLIYNKDSLNILIDEPSTDTFSFYGDRRNNIHLLLYFNVHGEKYDIMPGELPVMKEALKLKIPIIFLINKCPNNVFSDEEDMEDILSEAADSKVGTGFEKFDTYCINCLNGKGFDKLLNSIHEKYKKYIIKDTDLNKIKTNSLSEEDFAEIYKDSIFFGDISPKDVFLNESLVSSCLNIKKLIVKLGGYYSSELKISKAIKFYFQYKLYNNIWRNSQKNFFPLLTDLVQSIYSNFGITKTQQECNNFIKQAISLYFSIDLNRVPERIEVPVKKGKAGKKVKKPKKKKAPKKLPGFQYSEEFISDDGCGIRPGNIIDKNDNIEEDYDNNDNTEDENNIEDDNDHHLFLDGLVEKLNNEPNNAGNVQGNKIIDNIGNNNNNEKNDNQKDNNSNSENKNDNNNSLENKKNNNTNNNLESNLSNIENNLENNKDNQNKIEMIQDNNDNLEIIGGIINTKDNNDINLNNNNDNNNNNLNNNNPNNNIKIIPNIMNDSLLTNAVPAPHNFSFEKFSSDFTNLLNLYSDSRNNFRISEDLEQENLKSNKSINEIVLNKTKENIISPRRLYILIERDFGLDNSSRDATSDEKIILKLFYISYVSNELIGILCNKANQKSFQYTSIYNFYYTVSLSYNSAINGFMEISKEMKQKEKELKEYSKFKKSNNSEAPPAVYD